MKPGCCLVKHPVLICFQLSTPGFLPHFGDRFKVYHCSKIKHVTGATSHTRWSSCTFLRIPRVTQQRRLYFTGSGDEMMAGVDTVITWLTPTLQPVSQVWLSWYCHDKEPLTGTIWDRIGIVRQKWGSVLLSPKPLLRVLLIALCACSRCMVISVKTYLSQGMKVYYIAEMLCLHCHCHSFKNLLPES